MNPNMTFDNLKYSIKKLFKNVHIKKSYAQNGEDLILNYYIKNIKKGFFVDVGAFHPTMYSNTYLFYKKGWRGINIDANPATINLFNKKRKDDININLGVSGKSAVLDYYCFNRGAVNTFSKSQADDFKGQEGYKLLEVKKIQTKTLEEILIDHLPPNTLIDFMSIDVEGFDLEVLRSNNWEKFRPRYILAEDLTALNLPGVLASEVYLFLKSQGYEMVAKNVNTMFFEDMQ